MRIPVKLLDHIITVPLFEGLSRAQHEALARIAVNRSYKKGQTIFSEGDEGVGFYAIVSGRVKIFKLSPEGKEQILHMMGPERYLARCLFLPARNIRRTRRPISIPPSYTFPGNSFIELVKKDPSLSLNMLALLSWRLRRFAALIEDLSLKEVPGRLAAYLLYASKRSSSKDEFDLDISKGQLASILGTIPETLSRILGKMGRQGVIQIGRFTHEDTGSHNPGGHRHKREKTMRYLTRGKNKGRGHKCP